MAVLPHSRLRSQYDQQIHYNRGMPTLSSGMDVDSQTNLGFTLPESNFHLES